MSQELKAGARGAWQRHSAKCTREVVVGEQCPERPYLQLELPHGIGRVRRVTFRIVSHDQGFCDDSRAGSFSWCMVAVLNPSGRNRCGLPAILYNRLGDWNFSEHVKVWDSDGVANRRVQSLLDSIMPGDAIQMIPKARFPAWRNYVRKAEIEVFTAPQGLDNAANDFFPMSPIMGLSPFWRQNRIYETLDNQRREIRLMRLHPESYGDELSCSIEPTSLQADTCQQYEALSYCWGDAAEPKSIRVFRKDRDGESVDLPVTANLYRALKRLRSSDDADERVLWIDAICINQTAYRERAHQVGMMREIYARARRVLVWLGKCPPYIQRQIEDAQTILKDHQKATDRGKELPSVSGIHKYKDSGWSYMQEIFLFELDYFKRSWVLQEVFNARDVLVYCGRNVLPWSVVLRLNHCMVTALRTPGPPPRSIMPPVFSNLFQLQNSPGSVPALRYSRVEHRAEILDVFLDGLDLEASDPRDKLFALLSFGLETCNVSKLPVELAPDYNKSTGRVFADFTRWWIINYRSLGILSTVHASKGRSWQAIAPVSAPPYEGRASWSIWHDGRRSWAHASLGYIANPFDFHASGDMEVSVDELKRSEDPMLLELAGRKVGTIESIKPYPYYQGLANDQEPADFHKAYDWIFDPAKTSRTWLMGASDHETARNTVGKKYRNFVNGHFHTHSSHAAQTMAIECHDDSYFLTKDGRAGLCPPGSKTGDIVAVLHGSTVPFVLRQVPGSEQQQQQQQQHQQQRGVESSAYHLIGECCLKGVMRGQAVRVKRDGSPEYLVTTFKLI